MSDALRLVIAGTNSVMAYFGEGISEQAAARVAACAQALRQAPPVWLIDMVPSYGSLLVIYDPFMTDALAVRAHLRELNAKATQGDIKTSQLVRLPVYYHESVGPDLIALADKAGLTPEQVIEIHTQQIYRVYAIGFAPGFAYLGEVDPRIAAPRLATPRTKVPKGAVAIADRQTAVYPAASPGGWNLIGRCPTPMFNPKAEPTMPVQSGDQVQFYAIDKDEYLSLGGKL
ncbi:5-oxoprolinase subunit PxpB [Simiduia agarivorans]|uniref:Carboxyltransferase domain-containing protein n=1 Tax=Simiduia agarivorans (strain DSM 21679 / JCM 13881 / BCRC 17597 / SA1) TaxID=1117647 RepID=K4KN65_SIMAS|nr:5-oxoprolinase subunit PxpB [Simiduia agarivorans]AFU99558.1 hypothetical protein M5M_11905 [Simiduia agarivorans SA1 = DSM 21679]